jgi:ferredoxin
VARWIFFADQGEFRTGDYQEIMNKASCLSLVSNVILEWNTLQIARILETLQQTDQCILCGRCVEACQNVEVNETLSIRREDSHPGVLWDEGGSATPSSRTRRWPKASPFASVQTKS